EVGICPGTVSVCRGECGNVAVARMNIVRQVLDDGQGRVVSHVDGKKRLVGKQAIDIALINERGEITPPQARINRLRLLAQNLGDDFAVIRLEELGPDVTQKLYIRIEMLQVLKELGCR